MNRFFHRDIMTPRKGEYIGGAVYWPMYLIGTSVLLSLILGVLGVNLYSDRATVLLNFLYFTVNFVAVGLIFRKFLYRSLGAIGRFGKFMLSVLMALGVHYSLSMFLGSLYDLMGLLPENQNQEGLNFLMEQFPGAMALFTILLVPVTEECLCRGVLFAPFCRKLPWLGYILSSVVFSFIHVVGSIGMAPATEIFLNFILYLPPGIALCFAYQRTRTIWGPIFAHMIINLIAFAAQFLP